MTLVAGRALESRERRVYSQGGEDGVLSHLFDVLGTRHRYFVEFGAKDGIQLSNTANLRLHEGWTGLLLEGDPDRALGPVETGFVTAENINDIFSRHGVPADFDLLSIDIDGNDYWVWKALQGFEPRVVVIEYNPFFGMNVRRTIRYDPDHRWDQTRYHGASLAALRSLGHRKGYALVYTDRFVPNAFFVRRSELPADFVEPPIEEVCRGIWHEEPPDAWHRDWVTV